VGALAGRTIAVTGASGFVGSHIALALLHEGATVIAAVRTPAKAAWLAAQGVVVRAADLADRAALAAAFAGADGVVANAALGSHQGDLMALATTNVEGVRNTLAAARDAGVTRAVAISSVAVYRTRLYRAMTEDTPGYDVTTRRFNWSDLTTDWRYARSKTLAEAAAWEDAGRLGLALTCLRPGPVYGSRDPKATAKLVAAIRKPVRFVPTVGVPWVHAGDVAAATVAAFAGSAAIGKGYTLAAPPVSLYRVMRALKRALAARGEKRLAWLVPVPVPVWVRYDTTAAERDLAFRPRTIDAGMAEVAALVGAGAAAPM
jgi:nucleoside-diphosphate-sugar epimerase